MNVLIHELICFCAFCVCNQLNSLSNEKYLPILFFETYENTKGKLMDRWFYDVIESYIKVSEKSVLWGVGFDGYNSNSSAKDNIVKQYGSLEYFSGLMVFADNKGKWACIEEKWRIVYYGNKVIEEIKNISDEILVIVHDNDCPATVCSKIADVYGNKILMLSFASETDRLGRVESLKFDMIVHSPYTASISKYFSPVDLKGRIFGVVLLGKIDPSYPLRQRWEKLIETGLIPGAEIIKHPGYFIEEVEVQREKYVGILQSHKVMLTCSRVSGYQTPKYAEAALAGILIIADLPYDDQEFWAEHIVPVDVGMSDVELIKIVVFWISHDEARIAKTKRAQEAVLFKYTTSHTSQLIAGTVLLYKSGFRGIKYNYPFVSPVQMVNEFYKLGEQRESKVYESAGMRFYGILRVLFICEIIFGMLGYLYLRKKTKIVEL